MSGLQDKIDNIEETLKSYEAEVSVIVEKGIDIDNNLINEQFIDEKVLYFRSVKNTRSYTDIGVSIRINECFVGKKV